MKNRKQASILIVEDHELMRMALRDSLQQAFPGYRIDTAANGEESIAFLRRHRPEVVLMDVRLPGMNGIEAARGIKKRAPATAVIMCTGSDDQGERAAAELAGATAWIPKDHVRNMLVPTIRGSVCALSLSAQGRMAQRACAAWIPARRSDNEVHALQR